MKIRVLTFNMHHGKGTDGMLNMNRIARVIRESDADLVGLNEVDQFFSKRSDHMDQLLWISTQLRLNHSFSPSVILKSQDTKMQRKYGNGFLSRYPIKSSKNHILQVPKWTVEGRSLLETDVYVNGIQIKVYVTHLSLNPLFHPKQVDLIIQQITKIELPIILMGDLNLKRNSRAWKILSQHLIDVSHTDFTGKNNTYPSHEPKSQLDYIFVSKNIEIESVEVLEHYPDASDHLPLKATLILHR